MIQEKIPSKQESAGEGKPEAGKETSTCSSFSGEGGRKGGGGICHQCPQVAHLGNLEMLWARVFQGPLSCAFCPVSHKVFWSSLQGCGVMLLALVEWIVLSSWGWFRGTCRLEGMGDEEKPPAGLSAICVSSITIQLGAGSTRQLC